MPWWWNRRRRPWYTRWRKRRNTFKKRRWPRRRRYQRRRRHRRTTRRRRRRRGKVRKKRKTIPLAQWQPDTIRKCKIKGWAVHVLGVEGKQFSCYTDNRFSYTPPLQPGGGGFGVEKFTLQHAYEENKRGNNIWTQGNTLLDLARYTGTRISFFRHPHADFVASYSRQWPMNLKKHTYPDAHPFEILKARHHIIIPSMLTKPHGKRTVTIKIKPPKQLTNKWYFQETIANTPLFQLNTAVADLRYPHIGCCNTNQLMSFAALNLQFYRYPGWGNNTNPSSTESGWYKPYPKAQKITQVKLPNGQTVNVTIGDSYQETISIDKGWFQPKILQATSVVAPSEQVLPTTVGRYNPSRDTGEGNVVWLVSVVNGSYAPPKTDDTLVIEGLPLWQSLWGFTDYVNKIKHDSTFLETYYMVIRSKFIEPAHTLNNSYIVLDNSFIQGKGPYDSYVTQFQQSHWYPTLSHQIQTLNNFVECGPFVPNYQNQRNSTWELYSKYTMYFKFGGAALPEQDTASPQDKGTYDVPSNIKQTVQISNPTKINAQSTIHTWDLRRGVITSSAYKRMQENAETDTDFQTDTDTPPKKKKKLQGNSLQPQEEENKEIKRCLRSLCESTSSEEQKDQEDLLYLIHKQQQKQLKLKHHLLQLITDLKNKQKVLQLQTGILE